MILRIKQPCPAPECHGVEFKVSSDFSPDNDLHMVGQSPNFTAVLDLIHKFSKYDASLLILGETGTGKEMVARAIHYLGNRSDYPFIPVNCGGLPEHLVENELFGHTRGAFTDARDNQPGLIAQTQGGTLFLDEINALSMNAQAALLRFLQDSCYRPLGGQNLIKSDVRIITASNQGLHELVKQGHFRQDLLFRLEVLCMVLPPLRERTEDIELLSKFFISRYCSRYNQPQRYLHPETLQCMQAYDWPGNIRELENFIHRAFILSNEEHIHSSIPSNHYPWTFSPTNVAQESQTHLSFKKAKAQFVEKFERNYLLQLMSETRGNISEASRRSGKERRTLGKLLKKYGIHKTQFTQSS